MSLQAGPGSVVGALVALTAPQLLAWVSAVAFLAWSPVGPGKSQTCIPHVFDGGTCNEAARGAAGCMAALEAEHYLAEHGAEVPSQAEAHWKPTATVTTQSPVNANGHATKGSPVLA